MKVIIDIPDEQMPALLKKRAIRIQEQTVRFEDYYKKCDEKHRLHLHRIPEFTIEEIINKAILAYCEGFGEQYYIIEGDEMERVNGLLEGEGFHKMTVRQANLL